MLGEGAQSSPVVLTVADVPDAPMNLKEDSSTANSITFSWTEPNDNESPITDYNIYWD
jgi:hypothetical protein